MLRPLNLSDLEFLYRWENDSRFWKYSEYVHPYSREMLVRYLNAVNEENVFVQRQVRFVICISVEDSTPVGMVDLYDMDFIHRRAGVGILIVPEYQRRGFARQALEEVAEFAKKQLNLAQLYAYIRCDNKRSEQLFQGLRYDQTGTLRNWVCEGGCYFDVCFYQKELLNRISQ